MTFKKNFSPLRHASAIYPAWILASSGQITGNCPATEFHSPKPASTTTAEMKMDAKSFQQKFGKDVKHLAKTEGTCPFNAAVEGIIKLRQLHVAMNNAVLEAYGLSDVPLRHDFYEVYLPENDRIRYTIPPAGDTETTVGIEP